MARTEARAGIPKMMRIRCRLSIERIEQAFQKIDAAFLDTPQFICEPLGDELGARVALKIETLNPIRSFKGRGTELLVSQVSGDAKLVCASAGNFGQAMAYSCRKRGIPLTVYAAVNANPLKIERMRALGAEVKLHGEDFDAAKLEAKRVAAQSGAKLVEDSLETATGEGAGTIGLEWLRFPETLDALLVPVGNGAMLGGVGLVMKQRSPRTRIVAVQAAGAPAMVESWRAGRVIVHETMNTIADGIGVRIPVPEALDDLRDVVDDAILVTDEQIVEGMRLLHRHAGVVAEPSAGAGVAALLASGGQFRGQLVGTIVCGGNLTPDQMRQWL